MKKRSKTTRFVINEKFIFGAPRCMRCRKALKGHEVFICESCRKKSVFGEL